MSEVFNHKIEQKESQTPRPALLDVIKVDGRWAQVGVREDSICFIDEKTGEQYHIAHNIDWNDYNFHELDENSVMDLLENGIITDDEYEKIYWGQEQKKHPHLKGHVTVFGEYTKKIKKTLHNINSK